jgi:hypothetical protein
MESYGNPGQNVAVLTGDIVESGKLLGVVRAQLSDALLGVAARVAHYFPAYVPYKLDFFRGDSWQWLVTVPGKSLKLAVFIRSMLRNTLEEAALDTRIAIGIGTVEAIPGEDLARANGEAFRLSGDLLDHFKRVDRMRVRLPAKCDPILAEALEVVVQLVDLQVSGWTTKQAYAVCAAMLGFTQLESAGHWFSPSISQQAVGQHLDRAGWSAVEDGLAYFERAVRSILRDREE